MMEKETLGRINITYPIFRAGLQCPKRMYWEAHGAPEEVEEAAGELLYHRHRDEARIAAQALFPGALFDTVLATDGVEVRVDVLVPLAGGGWRLVDVKSGRGVEERHLPGVAMQAWVARRCGYDVVEAQVLHTNAQYRLDGALDVRGLFVERDVTAQIREWLAEMPDLLAMQRRILEGAAAPQIGTGIHCEKPLPCEYWDLCHEDPPEDHIVYLPGLHGKKREELLAQGVTRIGEIPDTFPLSEKQKRAREAVLTGRLMVSDQLKGELDQLEYPLWFIDFETVAPPVPRHAGMGPWQNIPFQWSAHRVDAVGAEPEHYSYLGDTRGDPRREFARTLVETVTGEGQVLVWYRPFEDGRLKELAAEYPEYRGRLVALRARLWDLLELVRRHVYHPAFFGSFSIKAVLPALVPGLSYDGLEVHRGDEASLAWDRMTRGDAGVEEHARVRRALEEYCRLDTLAMVKILEYLRMRVTARGAGI